MTEEVVLRVLIAEDERELSRVMKAVLELRGYEAVVANDGAEAVEAAAAQAFDCIVMDIMMPRLNGIDALSRIRAAGNVTPVILLTAKAEVEDRVAGLDAGADDYLTKPFSMEELLARIRSQTRRAETFTPSSLTLGNVSLDVATETLTAENSIRLPGRETKLLEFFLLNPDRDLTCEQILARVWPDDSDAGEQNVWVYVSYLRNKLAAVAATVTIEGERGGSFRVQVA